VTEPAGRFVLIVLAVLAFAAWWFNQRATGVSPVVEELAPPDGFYMTEAEITTAGADGLPRYRVIADEIRQGTIGGPTHLHAVRVEYNIYSPNPWLLTAPEGVLSADQSLLELWGGVEILGESADHGRTSVETERLDVDTIRHVAHTASPVDLSLGPQQVSAVGMVAYLLEERLQLQSSVHGRFHP
jgi:lipopolysaccharide export system protein LptC